jgi:hypothetical protein
MASQPPSQLLDLIYADVREERARRVERYLRKAAPAALEALDRVTLFLTFRCNLRCHYCNTITRRGAPGNCAPRAPGYDFAAFAHGESCVDDSLCREHCIYCCKEFNLQTNAHIHRGVRSVGGRQEPIAAEAACAEEIAPATVWRAMQRIGDERRRFDREVAYRPFLVIKPNGMARRRREQRRACAECRDCGGRAAPGALPRPRTLRPMPSRCHRKHR